MVLGHLPRPAADMEVVVVDMEKEEKAVADMGTTTCTQMIDLEAMIIILMARLRTQIGAEIRQ